MSFTKSTDGAGRRGSRHSLRKTLLALSLLLVPSLARAQSVAGTVRDASGGVLPGVSVEAASSSLIEKTRTAITDSTGQYRITDLVPGTYTLTFTLPSFATVKREGLEMSGGAVVSVNIEMHVGGLQETITVSSEAPVVDVQTSTKRQTVLSNEVLEALPSSRGYGNLISTVPGIQQNQVDNGTNPRMTFFTAHGGRGNEGTVQIDSMNVGAAFNGGGVSEFGYPVQTASEVQVTVTGGLGETDRGGPAFNIIPKTGGNKFSGQGFLSSAGDWAQGSNLDDGLRAFGITDVPKLINNWDASFSMGGPIVKDRLWFYGSARTLGTVRDIPGFYGNKNAGNPNAWSYVADPNLQERDASSKKIGAVRLTGQLSERNKVSFYYDYQRPCAGSSYSADGKQCRNPGDGWTALNGGFNSGSPESGNVWDDREKVIQGSWSSPTTSKLLLEAGVSALYSSWGGQQPAGALMDFIPVVELDPSAGVPVPLYAYRAPWSFFGNLYDLDQIHAVWRASATYVTGAHSLKIGYQAARQKEVQTRTAVNSGINAYWFFAGSPIQLTQQINNLQWSNRTRFDAFYAQDQWTRGRLTLQGALRFEHAWSWFPGGENGILGTSRYNSAPIVFPESQGVRGFSDITPRMGAAYDLFGNGKTAIKGSFSKYLQPANNESVFTSGNPAVSFAYMTDRSWGDANNDKVANCDLNNPAANGECGPWANQNFGKSTSGQTVNPAVLGGWGSRPYDWQLSLGAQHEIVPRISAEVSYNRRSWGNFYYVDNRAVSPSDYDQVTLTAASNSKLPGGGGYPYSFYLIKDNKFGQFDNYFTFARDYGDVTYYWHGFDYSMNARMTNGFTLQAGATTGHGVRDTCNVVNKLPETTYTVPAGSGINQVAACSADEVWQTNVRGLATYTIKKFDVLVSAIMRSVANAQPQTDQNAVETNGLSLNGNYDVTSQQVQTAIGRPLPGGAATQSVNLVLPGALYGPRINSLDFRVAKVLRFGKTQTNVGLDLYNIFNSNTGTSFNQGYGVDGSSYLRPLTILNPRFLRFNLTVDF